ncbi:sodium:solute symporter [Dyadobacter fermentans]|uniref:Na+/solute symporter n=1 Tax=Dyadobacter fermentans (strain ATCC 700827 / DSM 18053 / CIP 107007 / KCTC 52180 / NS114) TaxID=471854 RepID=C6VUK6_DYAFD|nr:sodium:solute symporter [Dyadobacter fermentans]ACT91315.1 Na+/solute symporter [Dyadobacter fermentans DSM 18053]
MSTLDWIVLSLALLFVVFYGIYRSREKHTMDSFLLAGQSMPWYHVTLSLMATQASAITFLSAPGQAYTDGMRFVQFYFGLPLAMVVLCVTFVPKFGKLKIFTAYEFLEGRFDLRTRALTAFLFLLQRGLSTGLSIYAPSLILSAILGWDITWTNIISGGVVILYTTLGGSRAVSHTHLQQMGIITIGMVVAGVMVVKFLPGQVSFTDALHVAGKMGKVNLIDFTFDLNNRYNVWSGLIGGFFLQLSYFGTDQSQVGRFLTGSSQGQSKLGLAMNGLLKIPMQFLILLVGVLVFAFYQFTAPPLFFNQTAVDQVKSTPYAAEYAALEKQHAEIQAVKRPHVMALTEAIRQDDAQAIASSRTVLADLESKVKDVRKEATAVLSKANGGDTNDVNYIFLRFVIDYLPVGMVGLLIAVILLASMGSVAAAYNSLASCTIVDIYKRIIRKDENGRNYVAASRWATVFWGIFCIAVAQYASRLGSMIEAVNILGSLFYGTILGIFLVAFYFKNIGSRAVFWGSIIGEMFVIASYVIDLTAFLWLNLIGCALVIIFAWVIEKIWPEQTQVAG